MRDINVSGAKKEASQNQRQSAGAGQSQVGSDEVITEPTETSYKVTFSQLIEAVGEQIEIERFDRSHRAQATEICFIVAEVMRLPPETVMQIGGMKLPAEMVREIYAMLSHEHVALVMEKYRKVRYEIKAKKTYLRTALYNAVFELDSHYINLVESEMM